MIFAKPKIIKIKEMFTVMVSAIILAGGKGKRMGTDISKQYIDLNGKPILYYTLNNL